MKGSRRVLKSPGGPSRASAWVLFSFLRTTKSNLSRVTCWARLSFSQYAS